MIRIKTLRRLIFLAEHIVKVYHETGRSEYLSFDEHLELLDVESISKALNISERTAYDYVAAIRELYRTLHSCEDMTEQVHTCEDMTEEPERPGREDMTDVDHCCDNVTDVQEAEIL